MTAQQFADMHGVWCAWDQDGIGYWYNAVIKINVIGKCWVSNGCDYAMLPPDVERPEGSWEQTLATPKPDASKLVMDQPIMTRNSSKSSWTKRHFCKHENGRVYVFNGGCTSWTADGFTGSSYWLQWRLPTEEEMGRKE